MKAGSHFPNIFEKSNGCQYNPSVDQEIFNAPEVGGNVGLFLGKSVNQMRSVLDNHLAFTIHYTEPKYELLVEVGFWVYILKLIFDRN